MGTRNITRVVSEGQLKVCQYCQWDGYPTSAGKEIVDFIRSSDDEKMVQQLRHVTLTNNVSDGRQFFTGAPYFEEAADIESDKFDFMCAASRNVVCAATQNRKVYDPHWYDHAKARTNEMLVEKYGERLIERWRIATRDTGNGILNIIYDTDHDLTVWTQDYLLGLGNECDWQIEAIWELDYDERKLAGNWHGCVRTWTFDELRKCMTDDEVEREMQDFENEDEED